VPPTSPPRTTDNNLPTKARSVPNAGDERGAIPPTTAPATPAAKLQARAGATDSGPSATGSAPKAPTAHRAQSPIRNPQSPIKKPPTRRRSSSAPERGGGKHVAAPTGPGALISSSRPRARGRTPRYPRPSPRRRRR
jgi:hypothetical protein